MRVDECIFFQLSKAGQAGTEFWGAQVAPLGITAVQALVLNFLREKDGTTSQRLGERVVISSATMTGILDRLEKVSLIERCEHEDRRAVRIRLTKKGRKMANEVGHLFIKANRQFLEAFSGKEVEQLKMLLARIRKEQRNLADDVLDE